MRHDWRQQKRQHCARESDEKKRQRGFTEEKTAVRAETDRMAYWKTATNRTAADKVAAAETNRFARKKSG